MVKTRLIKSTCEASTPSNPTVVDERKPFRLVLLQLATLLLDEYLRW